MYITTSLIFPMTTRYKMTFDRPRSAFGTRVDWRDRRFILLGPFDVVMPQLYLPVNRSNRFDFLGKR